MAYLVDKTTSSTRTRRGGSCLRYDYKTFFIYRTCTRRAPCVLALRELVVLLLSKNVTGVRPRCNATSSEHFLHTSHCTLHTLHFTLHTCTSHSTAHLISNLISSHLMSSHLTSSHLIPSLLTYRRSKFFSTAFIESEHSKKFTSTHLSSSARQKALTVFPFAQKALSAQSFCAQKLETQMHFDRKSWDTEATSYYKACTKYFPVLLRSTKLAQITSQYYFETTKLAQSTSQYYFVLQSLHKVLPSTTSH